MTSISSGILLNSEHLLENCVFNALRRTSQKIYYYKTKAGHEVDFLVQYPDRSKKLIQVCESMAHEKTKQREILALTEAMQELKLSSGIIVTRNEESEIKKDKQTIYICLFGVIYWKKIKIYVRSSYRTTQ